MSLGIDLLASLGLFGLAAAALLGHRVIGSPQFSRVTQQGGTILLGRKTMNAGYWILQPAIRGLARARVSPTSISWLSLVPALAAGFFAAYGHWGLVAWGLLLSALLDVLDGAVARQAGTDTKAGAILDSTLDRYAEFFIFAGFSFFYRGQECVQLLIFTALLGSFLVTYSTAKAEALQLTPPRGFMKRSDRMALLVVSAAVSPILDHWLDPKQAARTWPVLTAISLIAFFANLSAVSRFIALAHRLTPQSSKINIDNQET